MVFFNNAVRERDGEEDKKKQKKKKPRAWVNTRATTMPRVAKDKDGEGVDWLGEQKTDIIIIKN